MQRGSLLDCSLRDLIIIIIMIIIMTITNNNKKSNKKSRSLLDCIPGV